MLTRIRRRPDPARRQLAAELRAQGLTLEEIGRRLGCSKQNVSLLLQAGEQRAEGARRRRG
jgi:transcriptional regulator